MRGISRALRTVGLWLVSTAVAPSWAVPSSSDTAIHSDAPAATERDSYVSYSGTATASQSDDFLYRERHVLHVRDGSISERVVLYMCRDGSAFARKTVNYVDGLAPDFALEDTTTGMREGVRTTGAEREVFFKTAGDDVEKTRALRPVSGLVADTGFDEFVRSHWQALLEGKPIAFRFLVPSRLDDMRFQVRHVGRQRLGVDPVEVFRLEIAGVLAWVLPSIDVYYGAHDRLLVKYVGISDLRDRSHSNYHVKIAFAAGDRQRSDPSDLSRAREAPLAACKSP